MCILCFVVVAAVYLLEGVTVTKDKTKDNSVTTAESQKPDEVDDDYSDDPDYTGNDVSTDISFSTTEEITTTTEAVELTYEEKLEEATSDYISKCLAEMTVEEKIGQLFFIKLDSRFDETILEAYPVGGIILFNSDVIYETADSLRDKLKRFQDNSKIPLFIGSDEEGGTVTRVSKNPNLTDHYYQSPRQLYLEGGYDAIYKDAYDKSKELISLGINVNFAPVCDLSFNSGEFMYERTFGDDETSCAQYVTTVVSAMNDAGIGSVLKHFPGYGPNGDTHVNLIYDYRDMDEFVKHDFIPFIAGINEGCCCVLVSHNIVTCMDEQNPASLSANVHTILRQDLGFDGVIITDDLAMKGVVYYDDKSSAAVKAFLAGNDMLLSTYYVEQYAAMVNAYIEGAITIERLDESVERILRWKIKLGLIDLDVD